jgi:predicted DNA-binding transcriptional regulator YafY
MIKDHDKIAKRLGIILVKLNNGETLKIDDLAIEFNVSKRTIYRDINERLSYIPIIKQDGYIKVESYCLGKLNFNDIRTFATLSGIKDLYPALSDIFLVDLLNDRINSSYIVKGLNYEDVNIFKEDFENINIAITNKTKLSFNYKQKDRLVEPYKLININGSWYLLAIDDGILKHFTIPKITKLKYTNKIFELNQDILKDIQQNETTWINKNNIEVILKVSNEKIYFFERKKILPNQKIIKKEEHYTIVSCSVSFEDEIIRIAQYWIPYITIVEPSHLQTKFKTILQQFLDNN